MKTIFASLLIFSFISCNSALPKEPADPMAFKKSDADVKDMLAKSYENLKKSEKYLQESHVILSEVKEIERRIHAAQIDAAMKLKAASKEKAEAEKVRKRAILERKKAEKEMEEIKLATPTPTPVPSALPYSKSDAP